MLPAIAAKIVDENSKIVWILELPEMIGAISPRAAIKANRAIVHMTRDLLDGSMLKPAIDIRFVVFVSKFKSQILRYLYSLVHIGAVRLGFQY